MKTRRIVYLADASSIHVQRWAAHFADKGYEIHVFSFLPGSIPRTVVHVLCNRPIQPQGGNWRYLLHLPFLRHQIHHIRPLLVHAHYLTSYGLLGALTGYHPLILTAWGSDVLVTPHRSWIYRVLLRFTLAQAAVVTSDAEVMTQELVRYGMAANRLITVPFGVNISSFHPKQRDWPKCGQQLISTRSLLPNSNLNTVLAALPNVRNKLPGIRLTIVGDGPERPYLEALSRELGVDGSVTWHSAVPHDQLPSLLRASDLYVAVTLSDSTSVSLLEAMACGVFPILSDIPANREWIESGLNGFLIPPQNDEALTDAIVRVTSDPLLRRQAAQYNFNLIMKRANWERNMSQVEEVYHSFIRSE